MKKNYKTIRVFLGIGLSLFLLLLNKEALLIVGSIYGIVAFLVCVPPKGEEE